MKLYRFLAALLVGAALIFFANQSSQPSEKSPICFYSNQCRQDLERTFLHAMKGAKESIDVQVYSLTDPAMLQMLRKKAREGVKTTVLYDKTASPSLTKEPFEATPYRGDGLMHRKIIKIDGKLLFVGSANLTTQSLQFHDNLVLGFYLPSHVPELWLLPEQNREALERVVSLINSAQKTIRVALFTFTHPLLATALAQAKERGVDVKVAIDYYTGKGASSKTCAALKKAGIPVYFSQGLQLFHHKWAHIDSKTLISGSANWTKAAFTKNQECFVVVNDLTEKQNRYLTNLWNTIELEAM